MHPALAKRDALRAGGGSDGVREGQLEGTALLKRDSSKRCSGSPQARTARRSSQLASRALRPPRLPTAGSVALQASSLSLTVCMRPAATLGPRDTWSTTGEQLRGGAGRGGGQSRSVQADPRGLPPPHTPPPHTPPHTPTHPGGPGRAPRFLRPSPKQAPAAPQLTCGARLSTCTTPAPATTGGRSAARSAAPSPRCSAAARATWQGSGQDGWVRPPQVPVQLLQRSRQQLQPCTACPSWPHGSSHATCITRAPPPGRVLPPGHTHLPLAVACPALRRPAA